MPLKALLPSLDGLDEATQKLYKKLDDGSFQLDVEGLPDGKKLETKLEEFRANNIELQNALKKLKEQAEAYRGIDPTKAKEALDKLQQLQDQKLIDEGKIEDLFTQRTERMKSEHSEQLALKDRMISELEGKIKLVEDEKNQFILFTELAKAIDNPAFGFQSGVADLLKRQVKEEFQYRDEKVVRVKPDGSLMYGKNGEPVGLTEFLAEVAKERPYLVKPSSGGGAHNNGSGNNGGANQKVLKRDAFDGLSVVGKAEYIKTGGKIVD